MIDGIKAHIKNVDAGDFLSDSRLEFTGIYNASTGEAMRSPLSSQYNGLTVRLVPSTVGSDTHCFVDGSIHRFYNRGLANNTDFEYWQLKEAIIDIESLLNCDSQSIKIQNLEFGVNLNTELTAAKVIRSIVSNGGRRFAEMCVKDVAIGKICTKAGADYELKIYDKGKQTGTDERRLLRIEIKVKKMRFLERYGISALADLLNPEKIGILGQVLAGMWANLVFYDGSIDETQLQVSDLLKLKDYQNPLFWEDLGKHQAYKARKHFTELMGRYSPRTLQADIEKMILRKWAKLVNAKAENEPFFAPETDNNEAETGRPFHQLLDENTAQNQATFSPLEYVCEKVAFVPPEKEKDKQVFCCICGRSISHQKQGSKFCSEKYFGKDAKRCRNKASNQARTMRERQRREGERQLFETITNNIENQPVKISIERKGYKRKVYQWTNEIKPMRCSQLQKVVRVRGSCGGLPFEFTTKRAKEFIKYCSTLNLSNYESG
jgi:hypothetical protein